MMGRVENCVFRQRNKMIYSVNCPLDDEDEEEDYSKKNVPIQIRGTRIICYFRRRQGSFLMLKPKAG